MATTLTLSQLCAEYLRVRRHDLDEATKELAERACRLFDGSRKPAPPIGELTRRDGEEFKAWLIETGGVKGRPGRAKNSANVYLRAVKPVLGWAVERGMIAENPFAGIPQYRVAERPVTIYDDGQFERMLHFVPTPTRKDPLRDLRWLALLWGARTTGFRRGELLNVTWDNVRGGCVWVEPKSRGPRTWPWEPKTKRVRRVPLVPRFAEVLAELRACHYPMVAQFMAERLLRWQGEGLLRSRYCKCPEFCFWRTFRKIQIRAFGRIVGTWHQWRRTYTTDMAEELPDAAVMQLTGQRSRQVVSLYTAVRRSDWQIAFDKAAGVLRGPSNVPQTHRPAELMAIGAADGSCENGRYKI